MALIALIVAGYKTVVRLFPHEAVDLEPCLEAAEQAKKENLETWSTLLLARKTTRYLDVSSI